MAKKSFFEKLGLVESEEPMDTPIESGDIDLSGLGIETTEPVQAEVPEGDEFNVNEVYAANQLEPNESITIYKIQDMLNSLPAEMPSKTKKTTIKSLMATLGYDAAAIQDDAAKRIELLKAAGNEKMNALFGEMKDNDRQIESMKEEIERLTNRNTEASAAVEKMSDTVQNEIKEINAVLEYVKEDV